jgi:ATP-binding cassette subfamily C protein
MRKEVTSTEALTAIQEPAIVGFMALGLYVAVRGLALPLASVMVLVLLLLRVLKSLGKMQQNYQRMAANESAYWSFSKTLQAALEAGEAPGPDRPPHFERELVLEGVRVAFGDREVLRGIDLRLSSGSFTTLVGPSGAGKTTVLDVITGLVKPTSGRVLLDGVPLEACSLDRWRHMLGYVPQETLLLHDTVLHNVTLGDPGLSEADAENALRAAGAWEFVAAMPEGILTVVGERGGKLSGGQRQRVSIARALVRRPRLLILDEATSALDPASEAAICATLAGLRGSVTMLAVSHQAALGLVADRVLGLENGELRPALAGVADDVPGAGRPPMAAEACAVYSPARDGA